MTRLYNCSETPTGVFLLFFYRDAKMRLPFIRTQWSIPAQTARSTAKETVIYSSAVNGRFRYPAARTPSTIQLPKITATTPKFCFTAAVSLVHFRFGRFRFTINPNSAPNSTYKRGQSTSQIPCIRVTGRTQTTQMLQKTAGIPVSHM